VVREHYGRVAGGLTFGKASLGRYAGNLRALFGNNGLMAAHS
jgi:hypothetical protein